MNKAVRAALVGIVAFLISLCIITLVFLLIELMGFDYLLWDAPLNTYHTYNPDDPTDGIIGTLLYLGLPLILSGIIGMFAKSRANKRLKERKPAQASPGTATTVAAAMANAGYQDNLDKACSWADHLFPVWRPGSFDRIGTNADGSEEYLVRVSRQYDPVAADTSVQITFMTRGAGTAVPILNLCLLTVGGSNTKPTINQLCELTDERLDLLKDVLQQQSGHILP